MQSFAQESTAITHKDLYSKDGLIYKASNDSIFSGSIENRRWTNNILLSKEDYKDGFIILVTEYYNKSKKGIPYMKTYFHDGLYFKKKKQDRLDFDGTIDSTIYFDENENKILEEFFSKGKLIHSCEYKDGKKNGKQFCISKNGEELNFIYKNGKKVQ
ncbi:hypothetical protein B0A68_02680 [Flavobacterium reichenbachii]|uniref:MORN repeat protein n=2 Tax=Flavobacterium reichenbachii TaxID=362418 RepID=A0A085ZM64_9FLAO|nr:hypothetical protein IW19_08350 [Flavobacterium reichenbachii]OXB17863.1 hypothetical protein B0A68_02680 [Flavobacterium reichenbachii]